MGAGRSGHAAADITSAGYQHSANKQNVGILGTFLKIIQTQEYQFTKCIK